MGKTDIYGLLEIHWPQENTANTILSMLHHSISSYRSSYHLTSSKKNLTLHAEHFSVQRKNLFLFFYVVWRVIVGL